MRRPAEILTTLVVFSAVMAGIAWVVNASTPAVDAWLVERLGQAGFWVAIIAFWIVGGVIAYRGHRPAKGSAGKVDGTYPRARSD